MKIKIEADLNLSEKEILQKIVQILIQPDIIKLIEDNPLGEPLEMFNHESSLVITKL